MFNYQDIVIHYFKRYYTPTIYEDIVHWLLMTNKHNTQRIVYIFVGIITVGYGILWNENLVSSKNLTWYFIFLVGFFFVRYLLALSIHLYHSYVYSKVRKSVMNDVSRKFTNQEINFYLSLHFQSNERLYRNIRFVTKN